MNEDYRMALLQERYDSSHEGDDDPEVDEEDDIDYGDFQAWMERYRAWQELRPW